MYVVSKVVYILELVRNDMLISKETNYFIATPHTHTHTHTHTRTHTHTHTHTQNIVCCV